MDSNLPSSPTDSDGAKAAFRKPSNDVVNRKYRRRSPVDGSSSSDAPESLGDGCIRVHGVLYLKFISHNCIIQLQYFKERIPWTRMHSWIRVFSRLLAILLKRKIGILWNLQEMIKKKLNSSEGVDDIEELVSGGKKSHGPGWLIGRHGSSLIKTSTQAPPQTDSVTCIGVEDDLVADDEEPSLVHETCIEKKGTYTGVEDDSTNEDDEQCPKNASDNEEPSLVGETCTEKKGIYIGVEDDSTDEDCCAQNLA
ncbi:hypothetical protein POM88_014056 [Heracleum sosnowskyi]|uniref:Uncharacterized protein n=1 Tax=Heracleum sosnowskyi TaxID=360622 RepID=A0AAD8IZQ1_9APIA|nr:hypothetical protein POM88_014056 [Heracleum sosnowskyi]